MPQNAHPIQCDLPKVHFLSYVEVSRPADLRLLRCTIPPLRSHLRIFTDACGIRRMKSWLHEVISGPRGETAEEFALRMGQEFERLLFTEERLSASVCMVGIAVFSVSMDMRYEWAFNSQSFECPDQGGGLVGKNNFEMFAPEDAALLDSLYAQALSSGLPQTFDMRLICLETQRECLLEILVDPIHDEDGRLLGLAGAAIDLLPEFERHDGLRRVRVAADDARLSAENVRTQADDARTQADDVRTQADDARIRADDVRTQADDARIQANDGCNPDEDAGTESVSMRMQAAAARDLAETARGEAEIARIQADDARISADNARVLANAARIIAEEADHAADEAARNRVEEARSRAESASRAKTRLMAAAGHDLRQPLQAMTFLQRMIQERLKLYGDVAGMKAADAIGHAISSADELLTSLTSLATIEAGEVVIHLSEFPADDVMNDNVHEFSGMAEHKGLRLHVRPCTEKICSDPVLLKRIVRNLTVNAIKYTDKGGILVGCRRRGDSLRVEVWDSGRGVPEEKAAQIFDEFYRADEARDPGGGLGIGLSIVSRAARLLGHEITVRSHEGKGSLFAVTVPLAHPSASQPSR